MDPAQNKVLSTLAGPVAVGGMPFCPLPRKIRVRSFLVPSVPTVRPESSFLRIDTGGRQDSPAQPSTTDRAAGEGCE